MNTLDNYADAIARVESDGSGGYSAVGPATRNGDRAYGRYQVMGSNIPAWTQAATGTALTPGQFLADTDAQDKTFKHHFGNLVNQYGNPQDAASAWFTGRPQSRGGNASDGYITGNEYVRRFNNALSYAGEGSGSDNEPALRAINSAINKSPTGSPMADQGALNTRQTLGGGVLGGMGPALQDAGAFLMGTSPYVKAPDTNHSANFLKEAGPQVIKGQGMFGDVFYTLKNGRLQPMQFGNAPGGASAPGADTTIDKGAPSGMPPEAAYNQSINAVRSALQQGAEPGSPQVRSLIPGDLRPYLDAVEQGKALPGNLSRGGNARSGIMLLAHADTPGGFDEELFDQRRAAAKDLANKSPNALGGQIQSNTKFISHVDGMNDIVDALEKALPKEGHSMPLNSIYEATKKLGTDTKFNSLMNLYQSRVEALAHEYIKIQSGSQGSEASKEYIRNLFAGGKSPDAIRAGISDLMDTSHAAITAALVPYNSAFRSNRTPEEFMTKDQIKAVESSRAYRQQVMGQYTNPGAAAPPANRPPLTSIFK